MIILSNVEFEKLVVDQIPKLKAIAKQRCDQSPEGFVCDNDLLEYVQAFEFTGDRKTSGWLKNLVILAKKGVIEKLRRKPRDWDTHTIQVRSLYAAKQIPFDLGQHVYIKDSGRYGSIVDYVPDDELYLVVLSPFQLMTYKKSELEKTAELKEAVPEPEEAQEEIDGQVQESAVG